MIATPQAPQTPTVATYIPSPTPIDTPTPSPTPYETPLSLEVKAGIVSASPSPSPSGSGATGDSTHEFPTTAFLISLAIMLVLFYAFFVRKKK